MRPSHRLWMTACAFERRADGTCRQHFSWFAIQRVPGTAHLCGARDKSRRARSRNSGQHPARRCNEGFSVRRGRFAGCVHRHGADCELGGAQRVCGLLCRASSLVDLDSRPPWLRTAIVHILRTGKQWKALPRSLGAASTVHDRFQEWRPEGVFMALWRASPETYDET